VVCSRNLQLVIVHSDGPKHINLFYAAQTLYMRLFLVTIVQLTFYRN